MCFSNYITLQRSCIQLLAFKDYMLFQWPWRFEKYSKLSSNGSSFFPSLSDISDDSFSKNILSIFFLMRTLCVHHLIVFSQAVNLPNEKSHVKLYPNAQDVCYPLLYTLHLRGQRSVFQCITSLCECSYKIAHLAQIPLWHFMEEGLWTWCIVTRVLHGSRKKKTFPNTDIHSNWQA